MFFFPKTRLSVAIFFGRFEVFIISVAGSIFLFSYSHAKQCMEAI